MKKKLTILAIIAVMLTGMFAVPTLNPQDQAAAASKYVKVLRTTFNKYKKAYKVTVPDLKAQLKEKKSQVSWLWETLEDFGYFYNYDTHRWELQNPEEGAVDDAIYENLMAQTGLQIDMITVVDSWKTWACYYCECDGDLYIITTRGSTVDVCQILN